jgi:predicted SprT family Zn-dependent metalloprotease
MDPNAARVDYFVRAWPLLRQSLLEEAPPAATVMVGFPLSRRSGASLTVGECHYGRIRAAGPAFGADNLIVIHPILLDRPPFALSVLLHEMIHAALGPEVKAHGKEFQVLAKRVGLAKPWTATTPDEALHRFLVGVCAELGPLPPGHYEPPPPVAKKPSPLRKYQCACVPARVFTLSPRKLEAGPLYCGTCRGRFRSEAELAMDNASADL